MSFRAVPSLVFVIASLLCATRFAWTASWTIDEPDHLRWSERLVREGITERQSQETFNSKTPIMVPGALLQHALGDDVPIRTQRFLARVPTLAWLALLYATTAWLGRRWFGAGALAAGFLALDPNACAHGALATVDVAFAVATLLLLEAIRRATERPSLVSGLALGSALALALTAKFTALVVLGPALLVPVLARLLARDRPPLVAVLPAIVGAGLCAWALVCLSYGLHDIGGHDRGAWESPIFQALGRIAETVLAVFPFDFLAGIDSVVADDRRQTVNVVLDGASMRNGVPTYFAWCALLKTPLAVLAATLAGVVLGLRRGNGGLQALSLAVVVALVGIYFSFFFETQVGYRYVLMLVPLAYLLAARGWTMALGPTKSTALLLVVALLALAETAPYREHPLAFTNAIVSDKRLAFRSFADSNLDWGQDGEATALWVADHHALRDPYHLLPGTNLFGASMVAGVWFPDRYEHLRTRYRTPDEAPFFSQVVWNVDAREFDAYLDAYRMLGDASRPTHPCTKGASWDRIPKTDSLVCVDAPQGGDLLLEPKASTTIAVWDGTCDHPEPQLFARQVAWFRVTPGTHLLCVRGGPAPFRFARGSGTVGPGRATWAPPSN